MPKRGRELKRHSARNRAKMFLHLPVAMNSFYGRFLRAAEAFPDHIAVELQRADVAAGVDAFSFAQLRTMAENMAGWISASGLPTGTRCCILATNSPRWV